MNRKGGTKQSVTIPQQENSDLIVLPSLSQGEAAVSIPKRRRSLLRQAPTEVSTRVPVLANELCPCVTLCCVVTRVPPTLPKAIPLKSAARRRERLLRRLPFPRLSARVTAENW